MADKRCFNRQWCRNKTCICVIHPLLIEYGGADVPVGIRGNVVQIERARAIIQTVVAITEPKGDRPRCRRFYPLLLFDFLINLCRKLSGGRPPVPLMLRPGTHQQVEAEVRRRRGTRWKSGQRCPD